jgi:hypothetical protein
MKAEKEHEKKEINKNFMELQNETVNRVKQDLLKHND